MTLQEIQSRRSIRRFTSELVTDDEMRILLEAGQCPPSAMSLDPWSFLVVKDPADIALMTASLPYGRPLKYAGAGILICGEQARSFEKEEYAMFIDCSLAIENISLAATGIGLGTCCLVVTPKERAALRKAFNIPEDITPILALAVGHPAESPEPRSRFNASKVHIGRW